MAKIYASIAGQGAARRTVGGGEDPADIWYEAWLADESDENQFLKYPSDPTSAPFGWWGGPVGVRRGIVFFDTTGVTVDKSLYLFNGKASAPCYYGGTETLYILSGNGADPDFDEAIYGWIRGRFSPSYLIDSKLVGAIPCQEWGEIFIPQAFINSSGYTVLIVVLEKDYSCDKNHDGTIGTYLRLDLAYLDTPTYTLGGYRWVEGTKFAYLDAYRTKRLKEGTATGVYGTPGYMWVDGTRQYYTDETSGEVCWIEGTLTGLTGKVAGQWSINLKSPMLGTFYCYIDETGAERCFEGT